MDTDHWREYRKGKPLLPLDRTQWVVGRADELRSSAREMTDDAIRSFTQSAVARQPADGDELCAAALATSREVLRREFGSLPQLDVVRGAAVGTTGNIAGVGHNKDVPAALLMAAYCHSLAARGVHVVTGSERSARSLTRLLGPVWARLGCAAELVTGPLDGVNRRAAYEAMVTVGAWEEMAADYLRDNLSDSLGDLVQRPLFAAVVDDIDSVLPSRALAQMFITAPAASSQPDPEDSRRIAAAFRKGSDYKINKAHRRVVFNPSAMARLKSAVDWRVVPSMMAVRHAMRVEEAIKRREKLANKEDRRILACISVQGFLRSYAISGGFTRKETLTGRLDDATASAMNTPYEQSALALEELIDVQRREVYALRARVRSDSTGMPTILRWVHDVVANWAVYGVERVIFGATELLLPRGESSDEIESAIHAKSSDHFTATATRLIEDALDRRGRALGDSAMAAFTRWVGLTVIDVHWGRHLDIIGFLQRHVESLYSPESDLAGVIIDAESLFASSKQAMRVDAIKHVLNAKT